MVSASCCDCPCSKNLPAIIPIVEPKSGKDAIPFELLVLENFSDFIFENVTSTKTMMHIANNPISKIASPKLDLVCNVIIL